MKQKTIYNIANTANTVALAAAIWFAKTPEGQASAMLAGLCVWGLLSAWFVRDGNKWRS